jgi:hypothetical protein
MQRRGTPGEGDEVASPKPEIRAAMGGGGDLQLGDGRGGGRPYRRRDMGDEAADDRRARAVESGDEEQLARLWASWRSGAGRRRAEAGGGGIREGWVGF